MLNDDTRLQRLYLNMRCHELDYLVVEDTINFNWSDFFELYYEHVAYLYEHLEKVQETPLKGGGVQQKYSITDTDSNIAYTVVVNMLKSSSQVEAVAVARLAAEKTSNPIPVLSKLEDKLNNFPNTYVCSVYFMDSTHNMKLTGSMGTKSTFILRSVYRAVMNALSGEYMNNVCAFHFRVLKNESKRLKLYDKLLKQAELHHKFTHHCVDHNDNKYINSYYF